MTFKNNIISSISHTYIIAEAGVNHNGNINIALQLIDKAKESGADCVKFQTFKAEQLVTKVAPKAKYQLEVTDKTETQFEMLKKSATEILKDADALIIVTEWGEFRTPDFNKIKSVMKSPVIFDGRNIYDPKVLRENGFTYSGIGRKN